SSGKNREICDPSNSSAEGLARYPKRYLNYIIVLQSEKVVNKVFTPSSTIPIYIGMVPLLPLKREKAAIKTFP
ncbi:MAG: hypothetical protein KKC80_02565, partial [Candidatus Margulisbacteria bacterium]|nr:hypothetical protein [Candidatus Margulisiibacteriota bacterium]MBU1616490.1 hypothetical protein [Candidatus Margulisiibacteriota bacterium]